MLSGGVGGPTASLQVDVILSDIEILHHKLNYSTEQRGSITTVKKKIVCIWPMFMILLNETVTLQSVLVLNYATNSCYLDIGPISEKKLKKIKKSLELYATIICSFENHSSKSCYLDLGSIMIR